MHRLNETYPIIPPSTRLEEPHLVSLVLLHEDGSAHRKRLERTQHAGSFLRKQHVGVLTAVTALL